MIKIRVPPPGIERRVEEELPQWKADAAKRTRKDIDAGGNTDRSAELWSQVKPILKEVQLNKCAYCERFLGEDGREWQVEHYRPKRGIKIWPWPGPPSFTDQAVPARGGYYLLAHDIGNYLGSCGSCNNFKHNYFPVSAPRQLGTADRSVLASERPLLVNPIDAEDDDPEELIDFYGPVPQARPQEGMLRLRALASIEVVNLMRQALVVERCLVIKGIWLAYTNRNLPGLPGEDARESLAIVTEPDVPVPQLRAVVPAGCAGRTRKKHVSSTRWPWASWAGRFAMRTLGPSPAGVALSNLAAQ